jgi:hypothetical protein
LFVVVCHQIFQKACAIPHSIFSHIFHFRPVLSTILPSDNALGKSSLDLHQYNDKPLNLVQHFDCQLAQIQHILDHAPKCANENAMEARLTRYMGIKQQKYVLCALRHHAQPFMRKKLV